jgi:hypothetical protein
MTVYSSGSVVGSRSLSEACNDKSAGESVYSLRQKELTPVGT